MFTYTFTLPSEPNKDYPVMWDYQIGLVRITPFFKACKYSKVSRSVSARSSRGLTRAADHTGESSYNESWTEGTFPLDHRWCPRCSRILDAIRLCSCGLPHLLLQHSLGTYTYLRAVLHQGVFATRSSEFRSLQNRPRGGSVCSLRSRGLEA